MKKIKKSKVLILGVFIYISFQLLTMFIGSNIETLALEVEELELKITTKGLIIRDEKIIKSNESGSIEMLCETGERIKKSQEVANIYSGNDTNNINMKIDKLNDEIDILQDELDENQSNLSKDIKQSQLSNKVQEKKILEDSKSKNISTVDSSMSGVISYKFDGNEEKYTLENIDNITKEDINEETNNYKTILDEDKVKKEDEIARVINTSETYIALSVDKENEDTLELNQEVQIRYEEEIIDGKVYKINKNKSEIVIILKILNQNVGIHDTRVEEFDIIYKQIEGLKIPKKSVKTLDNKSGVYIVNQQTKEVEFIEIKGIKYEDEEFIFVDYYQNTITGEDTVSLYDEIIVNPNGINKNVKVR